MFSLSCINLMIMEKSKQFLKIYSKWMLVVHEYFESENVDLFTRRFCSKSITAIIKLIL